jgi:hypothetical protein
MRIRELVQEQAPMAPLGSPPMDLPPMGPAGGMQAQDPTISKAEIKHKQLHNKELAKKDMPAVTALIQIQQRIKKDKLEPKVNIDAVLDQLGNALRTDNYTADSLRDLNDRNPAVKNVVKNIEPDAVIFKTSDSDTLAPSNSNMPGVAQQTVSSMANKALKRRQK